jgi:hypothetical protein
MRLAMKTRPFLAALLLAAVPVPAAVAQDVVAICRQAKAAKDAGQLTAVLAQHSREMDLEKLRAEERASEAEKLRLERTAEIVTAQAKLFRGLYAKHVTAFPTVKELEERAATARARVQEIENDEARLAALRQQLSGRKDRGETFSSPDSRALQEEIARLTASLRSRDKGTAGEEAALAQQQLEERRAAAMWRGRSRSPSGGRRRSR